MRQLNGLLPNFVPRIILVRCPSDLLAIGCCRPWWSGRTAAPVTVIDQVGDGIPYPATFLSAVRPDYGAAAERDAEEQMVKWFGA